MRSQPGCNSSPFLESLFINVYCCCLLLSATTIWKVCESAVEPILENRLHTSISWGEIKVISVWKHQWTIKFPRPLSTPQLYWLAPKRRHNNGCHLLLYSGMLSTNSEGSSLHPCWHTCWCGIHFYPSDKALMLCKQDFTNRSGTGPIVRWENLCRPWL